MSIVIRLPMFVLMWAGFIAIKVPTALLGFVLVPFLYRYRLDWYESLPPWTRPWANPEDWYMARPANKPEYESLPWWWVKAHGTGFWSWYKYHAVRNPANGLRSFEWLDLDVDPARVDYRASVYLDSYEPGLVEALGKRTAAYIAWQGIKAGIQIIHVWPDLQRDIDLWLLGTIPAGPKYLVIKFGWRVHPCDKENPAMRDRALAEDSGFAGKVLPYRNWAR